MVTDDLLVEIALFADEMLLRLQARWWIMQYPCSCLPVQDGTRMVCFAPCCVAVLLELCIFSANETISV